MVIVYVSDFATFGPMVIWRGKFSLRSQMSFLTVATFTCFSSSPSRPWILVRSRRLILKLILVLSSFLLSGFWIRQCLMTITVSWSSFCKDHHNYTPSQLDTLSRLKNCDSEKLACKFRKWKYCLLENFESEKLTCKIRKCPARLASTRKSGSPRVYSKSGKLSDYHITIT